MSINKEDVKALLDAEKVKKVAEVSASVGAEFDSLSASVDAIPDLADDDVVANLKAAVAALEASDADVKAKLQADEELLGKLKALLS